MTRRRFKTRQCRRMDGRPKVRYETEAEASKAANPRAREHAYECEICFGWHTGHERGTTQRKLLNLRLQREAEKARAARTRKQLHEEAIRAKAKKAKEAQEPGAQADSNEQA